MESRNICIICKNSNSEVLKPIQRKGADGINKASKERCLNIIASAGDFVHPNCRMRFIDKKDIDISKRKSTEFEPCTSKKMCRSNSIFNNRTDCFFCGQLVDFCNKKMPKSEFVCVQTNSFPETIMEICKKRNDPWSLNVQGRLEYFEGDLHAADCVYHQSCSVNFRTNKDIPFQYKKDTDQSIKSKIGRTENEELSEAFKKVCSYIVENEDEQHTISELISLMNQYLEHSKETAYSPRYLKAKLLEHFGESIFISEKPGQKNIVILRESVSSIIRSHYNCQKSDDNEAEKIRFIETTAKLLKSDIKQKHIETGSKDYYPAADGLELKESLEYLPPSVKLLCTKLFSNCDELKIAAIGQCIIQACIPRTVITPMQLGLAVLLYSHTRSQFILDVLSHLGYCTSYQEIRKFMRNASLVTGEDLIEQSESQTVIFAADNIDHNIKSLKGDGTFHGMGMMAALTPGNKMKRLIPRSNVSNECVNERARINIYDYFSDKNLISKLTFQTLPSIQMANFYTDILWKTAWHLKISTPGWSGTMKSIHPIPADGKSSVIILPIINLLPSNMTCILSTMKYICHLANDKGFSPILTFDQPLFWKASMIANDRRYESEFKELVIMLGSFHTLMNLLGSIGNLMEGTGIEDVLETVYGPNTVKHIMTGKAVSRAFRAHMLVDSALSSMVLNEILSNEEMNSLAEDVIRLYDDLYLKRKTLGDVNSSKSLQKLNEVINKKLVNLKNDSLTSKLWLEYQSMTALTRKLVQADRTGSFSSHLEAIRECLPVFAAAGHTNYLKSAYLYLQTMGQLKERKPHIYAAFQRGLHVVHRSNTPWSGLGSDLVIEQVLMRSVKSNGGLTRGSGFSESMRAQWVLSMPATCEFSLNMQTLTRTSYSTSEQHKEMHRSRQRQDREDGTKLLEFLEQSSPFTSDPTLRNIVTRRTYDSEVVNVQNAICIGETIVKNLLDKEVFNFQCARKDRVKTLATSAKVKVNDGEAIFDPTILFQRLIIAANNEVPCLEEILNHELCPYPPSLFETSNMLRKTQKSPLANVIYEYSSKSHLGEYIHTSVELNAETEYFVIDGGSLLHRVPWKQRETFDSIASSYSDFICKHYKKASVVFDGYDNCGPTIKDSEHRRRGMNFNLSPTVNFTPQTLFLGKKEEFLLNNTNKSKIVKLIGQHLQSKGYKVIFCKSDADVTIVAESVQSSQESDTIVIGEDTDLLVLLLYHAIDRGFSLFLKSDIKRKKNENRIFDIFSIQRALGEGMYKLILFLHAYTGCDTTSYIHGIGKISAFKKFVDSQDLKDIAQTFCQPNKSQAEIEEGGKKAMLMLFGGRRDETLQMLRYRIFKEKVSTAKAFVKPEQLPPTESAVKYHSFRCYFQIQEWKGEKHEEKASNWGWFVKNNKLFPLTSDLPPAPKQMLSVILCRCKNKCETLRCSCKKMGLPCTDACKLCQKNGCKNISKILEEISSEESDLD